VPEGTDLFALAVALLTALGTIAGLIIFLADLPTTLAKFRRIKAGSPRTGVRERAADETQVAYAAAVLRTALLKHWE
jgi:hypothetical protein